MRLPVRPSALAASLLVVAAPLAAQPRWKRIGDTGGNNPVFVDPRSVKTDKSGIITATLRAQFLNPPRTARGPLDAARTVVMLDCRTRKVAIKENTYYLNEKRNVVYEHTVPAIPGYATAIGGSLPAVALEKLCPR